ncbi:Glyoxylase, beta-lactamase superfamily II [Aneurinibacillus thermoaerophilus]|uniref:Glyoxylase, beta-lactamase superfamily II n=1 Tax=Aneurinibacillus thermoaerophilus TaxID=143495 RepID=A0A1G8CJN4_ANETH|nr:MBL fold metallo-hydrolase [Aneurinibacillus thermoaerophilus]SDH45717.1 Glyoxylase, beta-lactamase superfamily II [Aneurinibacillus thermoaerophilus]
MNELTLVDTGYTNFLPLIEKEILKIGYDMKNLKNIIITHCDDDHIGSLYDFKEKYPSVTIIASEVEAKFISGEAKSERLVQAEEMLNNMPEEEKEFGNWFIQQLKILRHVSVDETVHDGQWILHNKCKIVATPGHTSGHISLYFPELSSVITGDAAVREGNELVIANPHFCLDIEKANQSLNRLKNLKAKDYYCYHGGKLTL